MINIKYSLSIAICSIYLFTEIRGMTISSCHDLATFMNGTGVSQLEKVGFLSLDYWVSGMLFGSVKCYSIGCNVLWNAS